MIKVINILRPHIDKRRKLVVRTGLLHLFNPVYEELCAASSEGELEPVTTRGFLKGVQGDYPRVSKVHYHDRGITLFKLMRSLQLALEDIVIVTSASLFANFLCLMRRPSGYLILTPDKKWYWVSMWWHPVPPEYIQGTSSLFAVTFLLKKLLRRCIGAVKSGLSVGMGTFLWLRSCWRLKGVRR